MRIYFDHQLCLLFSNIYGNLTDKQGTTLCTVLLLFIQLMYNKNDHLAKGGGEASKNKLKDASFIFSLTNVTILSIFRTHAQKEYRKVLVMKGT